MKYKVAFIALLVLLFLSAFSQNPAPLFATPLPEGRSLDEAHDSGYIDWGGSVAYNNLWHRDSICPSGCWEDVTRISNGGVVSGDFSGNVNYFEVWVVLTACSNSDTLSLYIGPGGGAPVLSAFHWPCLRAALPGHFRLPGAMSIFAQWMPTMARHLSSPIRLFPPGRLRPSPQKHSRPYRQLRKRLPPLSLRR
jgi:hypothetical protein